MRRIFLLLLAANLGFGAFVYLRERAPNPDAQLAKLQMNADRVKIVPPHQMPPPAPVAPERMACVEWGSFGVAELARAQEAVDRLAIGERARRIEVAVSASYWVYIPPLRKKADIDKKLADLKELGVTDYFPLLEPGRWRYAISLGVFRSEDSARKHLAVLRQKGVRSAVVGEREQRVTQTQFLIREPSEELSARLVDLKGEFPGSELRAVECPPS